ncbi:MAG: hypothetical protein JW955_15355 [Sedimentisphaerales bacterium]|nr:hypothetical protein [Sedimentisphaerales bacterium]
MKKSDIHRPDTQSRVGLLPVIIVLGAITASAMAPTGANVGTVQFDAVFELDSLTRQTHVLLFARYWVGPDYYSASVIWAEPHGRGLNFAVYPPTLSLTSDANAFSMTHDLFPVYDRTYPKPLGPRGVFRCMYGDYPVDNVRFAEQEALTERVYATDLDRLRDANDRGFAALQVDASEDRIGSLQLLGPRKNVLKDIVYEYGGDGGGQLRRETVKLPEQPIAVGFQGKGLVVRIGGEEHQYRDFESIHHRGGRTATVEYEAVALGGRDIALPAKVQVLDDAHKQVLRSVRLLNFKPTELDTAAAKDAAERFGGFSGEHRRYRALLVKYWKKDPSEVNEVDVVALKQLRAHFEKAEVRATGSLGEKLREMNILMELNRMLGDEAQLERYFASYLSVLRENGCRRMVLVGGYAAIETSMLWRRYQEADRLLDRWLDVALAVHDPPAILSFAQTQVERDRCWVMVRLLEKSLQSQDWGQTKLAGQVLRCLAIEKLYEASQKPDPGRPESVMAQTVWVASSFGIENLAKALFASLREADRTFAGIEGPTEEQRAMKAQLDNIERALTDCGNPLQPTDIQGVP